MRLRCGSHTLDGLPHSWCPGLTGAASAILGGVRTQTGDQVNLDPGTLQPLLLLHTHTHTHGHRVGRMTLGAPGFVPMGSALGPRGQVTAQGCSLWLPSPSAHTFASGLGQQPSPKLPPLVLRGPSVLSAPGLSSRGWGRGFQARSRGGSGGKPGSGVSFEQRDRTPLSPVSSTAGWK